MNIGDLVQIIPNSNITEGDRDLTGIIVDIKDEKAKVIWELTENIHTQGIISTSRLAKHPGF